MSKTILFAIDPCCDPKLFYLEHQKNLMTLFTNNQVHLLYIIFSAQINLQTAQQQLKKTAHLFKIPLSHQHIQKGEPKSTALAFIEAHQVDLFVTNYPKENILCSTAFALALYPKCEVLLLS